MLNNALSNVYDRPTGKFPPTTRVGRHLCLLAGRTIRLLYVSIIHSTLNSGCITENGNLFSDVLNFFLNKTWNFFYVFWNNASIHAYVLLYVYISIYERVTNKWLFPKSSWLREMRVWVHVLRVVKREWACYIPVYFSFPSATGIK